MTLPTFLIVALFSARYHLVFHEETGFFCVALTTMDLWIIFGAHAIWERQTGKARLFPIALLILLVTLEVFAFREHPTYWPEMQPYGPTPRTWATTALTTAEPDSIIFGDWGYITPLRYMQFVEHMREDVMVVHAPLGDAAFMEELLQDTEAIGKKAYLLQPSPEHGPILRPAEP
jgi:hypothetical protein